MEEQILKNLLQNIDNKNLNEKEKLMYINRLLKYQNRKLKLYRNLGIDSTIGMFLVGMGIGTLIDSNNLYVPITLCTMGTGSILTSVIKRKIKYNIASNEDIKILKKKL